MLCVDVSLRMPARSCAWTGLALGVSVRQDPFEWMLEGVPAKLLDDQSPTIERVGVLAGLLWLCVGEPGRGVDVLSKHSLDLTLWGTYEES